MIHLLCDFVESIDEQEKIKLSDCVQLARLKTGPSTILPGKICKRKRKNGQKIEGKRKRGLEIEGKGKLAWK